MNPTPYSAMSARLLALQALEPKEAAKAALAISLEVCNEDGLDRPHRSGLLFTCSSVVLNAAFAMGDPDLVAQGRDLAATTLVDVPDDAPLHHQVKYNVASATVALCDMTLPANGPRLQWEPKLIANRLANREELRRVRRMYFTIGLAETADPHTRSAAFCNLANMLDHSGRWAEAYDFYLRALQADPENGNAAGNLALLLSSRMKTGRGQVGHLGAVYDHYVRLAQSLRDGTRRFASDEVADRWDQLPPTESLGHLSHGLEDADGLDFDYRTWISEHRLALSAAVEGLGTDGRRWDTANIETLYGETPDDVSPPILGAMNVLKSDYLVSRRLAFEGISIVDKGFDQVDDDPGRYVETLDYALYGTQYSKLLLAQRSALDVLDKTAVVANEHFALGDNPANVTFRGFWTTKGGDLRSGLLKGPGRSLPALALAELAADMDKTLGMYADSQALRNAGTHRIVHAALLNPLGVTRASRSSIDVDHLIDSTTLALQVTRSAYLYLIDLVAAWNHPDDHPGAYAQIPTVYYLNDRDEDPEEIASGDA